MFLKDLICNVAQLYSQPVAILIAQKFAAMPFKKTSQHIMQELAGVDCLKIEGRFAARLKPQHAVGKKSVGTVPIGA